MSSPLRDPRALSDWLQLDYFRQPRRLRRLRRLLTWATVLVGVGLLALALWPASHPLHQAGPLSTAHAMFRHDCRQCHEDLFRPAQRFWEGNSSLRSVSDAACLRCHDGPAHTSTQRDAPACVTCHREHRGHTALARPADLHCTSCHADLKAAVKPGAKCDLLDVRDFASHPEFELWRGAVPTDPGTIRFSHAHHLALTAEDVHEPFRAEVKKLQNQQCAHCHQLDDERRYMKPIRYDAHCKSCHALKVTFAERFDTPGLHKAAQEFVETPVDHPKPGESAAAVRTQIRERLLRLAQQFPAVVEPGARPEPERPLPGSQRGRAASDTETGWVSGQLNHAERLLFDSAGGCRQCHQEKTEPQKRPGGLPDYGTPDIPPRWFQGSTFRHDSHRMLRCTECHGDVSASKTSGAVLMPRLESCQQCHNPRVGARTDCVECHTYHDRQRERPFAGKLTIGDCTGKRSP